MNAKGIANAIRTYGVQSQTTRLDVPNIFWSDHCRRDLADWSVVVKELARTVRLDLTDDQMAELRSDADYYASAFARDEDPMLRGLASSAAATVRAIDQVEVSR